MRKATDRKRVGRFLGLMTSLALLAGSMGISGAAAQPAVFDSPYYTLDQSGRTIEGIYEGNTVEELLGRFENPWAAEVCRGGASITEGYLEEGMVIRILNGSELYGSYTVAELLPAFPQTRGLSSAGFCSPFEGIDPLTVVYSDYGDGRNHKGLDFSWGGCRGTPIRAVKSGVVTVSSPNTGSYGNYVKIDHGSGVQTLYAHMRDTPLISAGSYVTQGQVIGYIGTTGDSSGNHLHFEVIVNGSNVNPRPYLVGAGEPDGTGGNQYGRMVAGDFNGDGKDDIATLFDDSDRNYSIHVFLSNGSGFSNAQWWLSGNQYDVYRTTGRMVAGDFNGDGKDDIAVLYDYGGNQYKIHTFLSTGSSFKQPDWWLEGSGLDINNVTGRVVAGDFDGNGRDDIAMLVDDGDAAYRLMYFDSNGSQFTGPWVWRSGDQFEAECVTGRMAAGDFNGDGRCDIAAIYDYGYYGITNEYANFVFTSTPSGFSSPSKWLEGTQYNAANTTGRVVAGHFAGGSTDSLAAIYDYHTADNEYKIHYFDSHSTYFTGPWNWKADNYYPMSKVEGLTVAGDFNGDGRDDIATFYDYGDLVSTLHTFLSSSSGFTGQHDWMTQTAYNLGRVKNTAPY